MIYCFDFVFRKKVLGNLGHVKNMQKYTASRSDVCVSSKLVTREQCQLAESLQSREVQYSTFSLE